MVARTVRGATSADVVEERSRRRALRCVRRAADLRLVAGYRAVEAAIVSDRARVLALMRARQRRRDRYTQRIDGQGPVSNTTSAVPSTLSTTRAAPVNN